MRDTYLDGELCGVGPDGHHLLQHRAARFGSRQRGRARIFPVRSSLYQRRRSSPHRLMECKERLGGLLANAPPSRHYSDHVIGHGPAFYDKRAACMSRTTSSRNAPMRPTIAACGARSNASTAAATQSPKDQDRAPDADTSRVPRDCNRTVANPRISRHVRTSGGSGTMVTRRGSFLPPRANCPGKTATPAIFDVYFAIRDQRRRCRLGPDRDASIAVLSSCATSRARDRRFFERLSCEQTQ
jgi:hypothetical protein